MPRSFLLLIALLHVVTAGAQPAYPRSLFRNPLEIPILLAGNFGECRPGHFHSGIDIKTEGREGLTVRAAAAGYLSRIKMEPGGFGHALYLTHPEGYTTLYAHLSRFAPPMQAFTHAAQYRNENWELDTVLPAGVFPVTKGQAIAQSGNTGGSTAPHLHFEIRNTATERPLNPQLFGLSPADSRAPVLRAVYLSDLEGSVYGQEPRKTALVKKGSVYGVAGDTLTGASSFAGLGISGDDYADGSENTLAPLKLWYTANGDTLCAVLLNDIGYDETRVLHAYADYGVYFRDGIWVQNLYRLPGNALERIYRTPGPPSATGAAGGVALNPGEVKKIEGGWEDASGNKSLFRFWIKGAAEAVPCLPEAPAGKPFKQEGATVQISGGATALYDGVCNLIATAAPAAKRESLSVPLRLGRPDIPLHTAVSVSLKPNKPIPFAQRSRLALIVDDGKRKWGAPAKPDSNGWYGGSTRTFGTAWLEADTAPPAITPLGKVSGGLAGQKSIAFKIADATTGVASVRGTVDGEWVLFEQHGSTWTYVFDERVSAGSHALKIVAADAVGNKKAWTGTFVR